ncbi:hypothetical protein KP509_28G063300 [Ceratopteris richardii]|uniref:At4g14310 8-bladed propeller domain-containing protein n=1 Tax=Ceratopteris richardii TaxID=49495 RepID=A0A8T2RCV2_CERRI|nr:hypothetical protein KP509_28G063300 [Ceratopteris richardii]
MSPQRRKGRGGGPGKVQAPAPSHGPVSVSVESPSSLHLRTSRQRCKAPPGILPASCKSSITPSTGFPAKSKLKDRCRSIPAAATSPGHAVLPTSRVFNARVGRNLDQCAESDCVANATRSKKNAIAMKHEDIFICDSTGASPCARIRTRGNDLKRLSRNQSFNNKSSEDHAIRNKSSKNSLHKDGILRESKWLNSSSLSSKAKKSSNADVKASSESRSVKEWLAAILQRRLSLERNTRIADEHYIPALSDRRHSIGSSIMNVPTNLQSVGEERSGSFGRKGNLSLSLHSRSSDSKHAPCEPVFDRSKSLEVQDCEHVGIHESEKDANSYATNDSSRVMVVGMWKNDGQDLENVNLNSPAAESTNNLAGLSSRVVGSSSEVLQPRVHHPSDAKSDFSISLDQRLAVLEGRVSQIASELQKTKEMLHVSSPSGTVCVISDLQGKISNIQEAMMTQRMSQKFSDHQNNEPSETRQQSASELQKTKEMLHVSSPSGAVCVISDLQGKSSSIQEAMMTQRMSQNFSDHQHYDASERRYQSYHEDGLSHQDLNSATFCTGSINRSFAMEPVHQVRLPSENSFQAMDGFEYDQQELEDRLFPHRKLLRNRAYLYEGVMETRAALHSKLVNSLPQSNTASNVRHQCLPERNRSTFSHINSTKEGSLSCLNPEIAGRLSEIPGALKYRASTTCSDFHHLGPPVDVNPPTAIKRILSSETAQNLGDHAHPSNLGKSHGGASGQYGPCPANFRLVEATQEATDISLLQCDENLEFECADTNFYHPTNSQSNENVGELKASTLHSIGHRIATAGWFAYDGEAILLAHEDGDCSFYDAANMEEKALYRYPEELPTVSWGDCWLIRAAGSDGRASKYVVAAASNASDSGFCSWDFHSRVLTAYRKEDGITSHHDAPSPSNPLNVHSSIHTSGLLSSRAETVYGRNLSGINLCDETSQWWYRPCGPLMASAGSFLKYGALYDIRDGETIMVLRTNQSIAGLNHTSPLQWRSKGTITLAEEHAISIWDVNSLSAQCLSYFELTGKHVSALYVHNADAECSGGVRQRLNHSDMEAFDAVCCTNDDINILDFRVSNGIVMCLPSFEQGMQSVYARGDMVLIGGLKKSSNRCVLQQWSVRMGQLVCSYVFRPLSEDGNLSLSQVWASSSTVMAINEKGLHIFKGNRQITDEHCGLSEEVEEISELKSYLNPSFDYANSQILLISGDRPACFSYWAV